MKHTEPSHVFVLAALVAVSPLVAQDFQQDLPSEVSAEPDLATKLANPLASLISMPIQANFDQNYGADDQGEVWRVNVQPVIPISINEDWNIISRTIVPIIEQSNFTDKSRNKSGLGDTVQSVWLSPVDPVKGWIMGVGSAFLLPTATNEVLGGEQWGIGPTVVALRQNGPWTVGFLSNHIWSFAGEEERNSVNATFIQPFITYITKNKTSWYLNSESTFDWQAEQWAAPINFGANQMVKIGDQPLQVGIGTRYWLDSAGSGPEGWGLRLNFVMLFPK